MNCVFLDEHLDCLELPGEDPPVTLIVKPKVLAGGRVARPDAIALVPAARFIAVEVRQQNKNGGLGSLGLPTVCLDENDLLSEDCLERLERRARQAALASSSA